MKLPHLTVITISGAHATGKSTLMEDLKIALSMHPASVVTSVGSCSQRLFQRMQTGQVQLPRGAQIPKDYEDIDRNGLRVLFQRKLPDALSAEVELVLNAVWEDRPFSEFTFMLVDRWFPDIYAYTQVECTDEAVRTEIRESCRMRNEGLGFVFADKAQRVRMLNIFVPLKASTFRARDVKQFRATCDRPTWEAVCLSQWDAVMGSKRDMLRIAHVDRKERVEQVLAALVSPKRRKASKA